MRQGSHNFDKETSCKTTYHLLPICLINGKILRKKNVSQHKMRVLIFLYKIHLKLLSL